MNLLVSVGMKECREVVKEAYHLAYLPTSVLPFSDSFNIDGAAGSRDEQLTPPLLADEPRNTLTIGRNWNFLVLIV